MDNNVFTVKNLSFAYGRQQVLKNLNLELHEGKITTLIGAKATTCPYGRDPKVNGYPVRVSEMLAQLDGPSYIARVSTHNARAVLDAKKHIRRAFEKQIEGKGFALVEVLTGCPTNWGMSPVDALKYVEEQVIPYYPLGVYKDTDKEVR